MKTVLYLGLDPSHFSEQCRLIHYPVIALVPRLLSNLDIAQATHILFTSQHAVRFFFDQVPLQRHILIAIGTATAEAIKRVGRAPDLVSPVETQEGLVEMLKKERLDEAYFLLPRSSRSRCVLVDFFEQRGIRHFAFDLYDTVLHRPGPPPALAEVDEIVFTSPSTVEGFLQIYGQLPRDKVLRAIGPITRAALDAAQLL